MSRQEKQYIKGFNHGYLLMKHLPDLVAKLLKSVKETTSDYFSGFFSGKEEYEIENERDNLKELYNIRNRSIDREIDFENE